MLKGFLFLILSMSLLKTAYCQSNDTLFFYYKNNHAIVRSMDSADYFRMILPPDPGDNLKNIREYYKNGQIKFAGKFDPKLNTSFLMGSISLSGNCISYYPNGKKQSITHYVRGDKDGMEYLYYPNGQIYCTVKYIFQGSYSIGLKWECYDNKGLQICKEGNGRWLTYDDNYTYVSSSGQVKDGRMDGEWRGIIWDVDSIKYVVNYNKGLWRSGIGYDRYGKAYPFKKEREPTNYRGGYLPLLTSLNQTYTYQRMLQ